MEIFTELSLILVAALCVSMLMRLLRQPLIVGYIFTGILLGPYALNLIHSGEIIELFSKLGITILLFIVGLNLSPNVIKEVGKVSLVTGLGQVFFTTIIGFTIAKFLGIETISALYVAIALTFSSTIIILKLLSDKGDLNKLYGKIAIGFLLVQDIVATLILLVTTSISAGGEGNIVLITLFTLGKGVVVITLMIAISSYILPKLSKFVAHSQELLFLFALSWGLGLATLFYKLGFSVEIGALVAGVSLSMTPYAAEASARLRPLRDFFILLFFILLGSQMVFDNLVSLIGPILILSLYVLIGNPIIMMILMNLLGYSKRTGFMAGLAVAQISEFSLILATLGFQVGHLSREQLSMITFVGLFTIAGSTYFILYAEKLYPILSNILNILQLRKSKPEKGSGDKCDALLFGYQRVGQDFVHSFKKLGLSHMVVDFNPESIKLLEEESIPFKFGDAKDPEFLEELPFTGLKYAISTIPEFDTNLQLVTRIREKSRNAIIMVISENPQQTEQLYEAGASYVIMPHYIGAIHATKLIEKHGTDHNKFKEEQAKHKVYLEKRVG
ncbi:MAG: cation:proton antiporter [Weeksellaceae bacterium]